MVAALCGLWPEAEFSLLTVEQFMEFLCGDAYAIIYNIYILLYYILQYLYIVIYLRVVLSRAADPCILVRSGFYIR